MIEIFLLITLTRRIGLILKEKGRKSGWFKFFTILLWFGGEIIGAVIGGILVAITNLNQVIAYLIALLGAAVGAGIAFLIAKAASPATEISQPAPPPIFS